MCGIAGFIAPGLAPAPGGAALSGALCAIVHRGPDGEGRLDSAPFFLGMRRLAIIDLATGDQPLWSDDGRFACFLNGEIYNYRELKAELAGLGRRFKSQSDTEVIANAVAQWGMEGLARLNGMFAVALLDARDETLLIARDRFGIKPLHYAFDNPAGRFCYGSELKSLRALPGYARRLDAEALAEYLTLDYVAAPRSIDAGTKKLRPGEWLRVDARAREIARGRLPLPPPGGLDPREPAPAQIRRLLKASVERQLISDRPVGIFLSGGIDSAALAACVKEIGAPLTAFTIGFEDAEFDESPLAAATAKKLGLAHAAARLGGKDLLAARAALEPGLDEPFADPSLLPTFLLSRHTVAQVTVALSGDGGDELFGGYPTYGGLLADRFFLKWPKLLRADLLPAAAKLVPASEGRYGLDYKLRKFLGNQDAPPWLRQLSFMGAFREDERAALLAAPPAAARPAGLFGFAKEIWNQSPVDGMARHRWFDLMSYLAEGVLQKTDRASMAVSLEARVPFLDPELYALAFAIPWRRHHGLRTTKKMLRAAFADALPSEVASAAKQGFGIPVARWLKQELRGELTELLSPDRLKKQGLFNPAPVEKLVREHLEGRVNHRKPLWSLLCLQRWMARHGE